MWGKKKQANNIEKQGAKRSCIPSARELFNVFRLRTADLKGGGQQHGESHFSSSCFRLEIEIRPNKGDQKINVVGSRKDLSPAPELVII